ncbi:MAG: hypothetical protein ACLFTH_04080 [Candidatus Woesearchaeota archaeon]
MKNKILIANTSLKNQASHTNHLIDQSFLEHMVWEKHPEFETIRVDGYEGIGEYLSNFIPIRFNKYTPSKLDEIYTLNESCIQNDVKAIVIPIDHGDMNAAWHILYNSDINHVTPLLQKYHDSFLQGDFENASTKERNVARMNLEKKFSDIFDIHYRFEAHKFMPLYREDGPQLTKYTSNQTNLEMWTPVVEKAYEVWLDSIDTSKI